MSEDPRTNEEWQRAADSAETLLMLESARMDGLVTGGPKIDAERCEEILERARGYGIVGRFSEKLLEELCQQ